MVVAPESMPEKGAAHSDKARLEVAGKVQSDHLRLQTRQPAVALDLAAVADPGQLPGRCGLRQERRDHLSIRQTSIGFKGYIPTAIGELKTDLSMDMFGIGGGNTQIRVINAWGELGNFGAGQYFSLFMNLDSFPNAIDFWGPNGNVYLRNPQVRYTALKGDGMKLVFSLEAPSAAIDTGKAPVLDPTLGLQGRTQYPDIVGKYVWTANAATFQASGIVRWIGWETTTTANNNPSG